ncbi:MAG: O-antigen ligase family protein [Bacteroidia bacterium]|nr:O-antigen ligase family protein [Bacteroidia bacterium]NNF85784.1 O-antigen ligase family protein [Winogradskyella sp.]NNL33626.1 O-antigen ligase family protein [Flavobacteriaceae bacterium]
MGIIWFAEAGYILRGSASSLAIILPFTLLLFILPFNLSMIKRSIVIVCFIYSLLVIFHVVYSLNIPFFYADGAKSLLQPFVPDWPQRYIILLGIALHLLLHKLKTKVSLFGLLCFMVISYAFFMSFTRTAYLSLIISMMYYLVPLKPRFNRKALKYLLISTLVLILIFIYDYYNRQLSLQIFDKILNKFVEALGAFNEGTGEKSVSERFQTWKEILRFTFVNNPISGTGGIGAGVLKSQNMIDIPNNSAHSQYFDIFLRFGILGLVFFFYFFKRVFLFFGKEIKACIIFILLFSITHETLKLTYVMLFFILMINLSYDRKNTAVEL